MQDKPLQIQLDFFQSSEKPIQVESWVNTALDSKNNTGEKTTTTSTQMLQLNMSFSQSILNHK